MSFIVYVIPILSTVQKYNFFKTKTFFYYIDYNNIISIISQFILTILLINLFWIQTNLSIWFGHIIIYNFTLKMVYLNSLLLYIVLYALLSSSYFSSKEIYDFIITIINSFFWLTMRFFRQLNFLNYIYYRGFVDYYIFINYNL
jgi:hypothetical protein